MCDLAAPLGELPKHENKQCACPAQFQGAKHTCSCACCGKQLPACQEWEHAKICPARKFACACGQSFQRSDSHHLICPKVPCACPDCHTVMPREELATHTRVCHAELGARAELGAHTAVHALKETIDGKGRQIDAMLEEIRRLSNTLSPQFMQTSAFVAAILPNTLSSPLHPHMLALCADLRGHNCIVCGDEIKQFDGENDKRYLGYRCASCNFDLCIKCALHQFAVGKKVQRGRNWRWGNQDGGPGHVGTIQPAQGLAVGWVTVQWDNGVKNTYRMGVDGEFDLKP